MIFYRCSAAPGLIHVYGPTKLTSLVAAFSETETRYRSAGRILLISNKVLAPRCRSTLNAHLQYSLRASYHPWPRCPASSSCDGTSSRSSGTTPTPPIGCPPMISGAAGHCAHLGLRGNPAQYLRVSDHRHRALPGGGLGRQLDRADPSTGRTAGPPSWGPGRWTRLRSERRAWPFLAQPDKDCISSPPDRGVAHQSMYPDHAYG